ncbi:MAG: hypothetical protein HZA53_13520, partial [Planctomycetes bacterium]|nr:hypothetical protein [Planctomycetota bacterium]
KPASRTRTLWLAFLDQAGTVRAVSRVSAAQPVSDGLVRGTRVFREHGRPKRELPPFEREKR